MSRANSEPLGKKTANHAQHFLCHGISCLVNGKILPEMGRICRIGIVEQERAKGEQSWHARCYAIDREGMKPIPKTINTENKLMTLEQIENLYQLGGLSEIEFSDMLNKRWIALNKRINECTTEDSSWNDFQLWKAERQDINEILEKTEVTI